MGSIKNLAKDTVYYGMSTIVPKFLNWCLTPFYVNVLDPDAYGEVTNLYSYTALLLVILTYGMETGFFRFANDKNYNNPVNVFSTAQFSLFTTSSLFFILIWMFRGPLSGAMGYPVDYIWMLALIIAIDAFCSLPFAYLRFSHRPIRFMVIKIASVIINIGFNLFFLLLCPWLYKMAPESIGWFYNPDFGVGYIIVANLISSAVVLLLLSPEIFSVHYRFDGALLRKMLVYSFPILILGIAGIMNQTLDKILYPLLMGHSDIAKTQLGIYGAGYKIAVIMVMFISAFRFAFEPFIFAREKNEQDNQKRYVDSMHFFIIFGYVIFLGVCFYIDLIKMIIPATYYDGFRVVPIVMMAELFAGIFFNLSVWYKITDRTHWGAWFSIVGLVITICGNILFVPTYGYMACAWTALACYLSMTVISYLIGRQYYPIRYKIKPALNYTIIALLLFGISRIIIPSDLILRLSFRTILFMLFIGYILKKDLPLKEIPVINKWIK